VTANIDQIADEIAPLVTASPVQSWRTIEIHSELSKEAIFAVARLNSLGSLFWFSKYTLRHSRLSPNLHGYLCRQLETDSLRLALEVPRDMFKTTLASVSGSMWWALPFNDSDEELMRKLGYGDAWMRWMRRAHDACTRTLIASETIDNAAKIGIRIDGHYQSNSLFRDLFPEIIPRDSEQWGPEGNRGKKKARWNLHSMTHNRPDGWSSPHGEGTYDLIGVKGALQSRHYRRQIVDDPVGEKAIKSDMVMKDTCEWIKKLAGALDSDPLDPDKLEDQLFIGNRWSQRDVGEWLRKNQPKMRFETHSAEGGCCAMHPAGQSIFPEEFSMDKLAQLRQIWGPYDYSCQYLNNPIDADSVRFKMDWLRHFSIDAFKDRQNITVANSQQISKLPTPAEVLRNLEREELRGAIPERLKAGIFHETKNGETIEDMRAGLLHRVAILDPNHSEESGRSRNAIIVVGLYFNPPAPRRIYLLEAWAESGSHDNMIGKLLSMREGDMGLAFKWRVHHIYLESKVAGQQGWFKFFQERIRNMGVAASFSVRELKTDRTANAKRTRILGMEVLYENGFVWVNRQGCQPFLDEYQVYPNGTTIDLLDVMGYSAQCWEPGKRTSNRDMVRDELARRDRAVQSMGNAGY
jgi:hypothetical protein